MFYDLLKFYLLFVFGQVSLGVLPSLRSGRMRQLSRELLVPLAPLRENKEFKTDTPLRGYGLTAALDVSATIMEGYYQ